LDGAFKMEVQLGFWKGSNTRRKQRRRHPRAVT
jgi:hypothetical protein